MVQLNWKTDITRERSLPVINWRALQEYAIKLKQARCSDQLHSITCQIPLAYNMGGLHLVRPLIFEDGTKWIARIQLHNCNTNSIKRLLHEVYTLAIIREQISIPVPQVFGYEPSNKNAIGVAFMIMDFIPGDTAMDAFGGWSVHKGQVPAGYKPKFYRAIADIQVEMTSVRFSKIGMIAKHPDGSYDIGPIPGLGGPFETASEYFKAWANHANFPISDHYIRSQLSPNIAGEIIASIQDFPAQLKEIANQIPLKDGPFPLYHTDLLHSNIIIDSDYNILSIIDWENACTIPWEAVQFPLFLSITPPPMDAPWNYDSNGEPTDQDTHRLWEERKAYTQNIKKSEKEHRLDGKLSTMLGSQDIQNLASALKLYLEPGKIGYYSRILDCFRR